MSLIPLMGQSQTEKNYLSLKEALLINPDSVFYLDLSKEGLTEVPPYIFDYKHLKGIDLSKNKLSELPLNFVFNELEELILTNNKFYDFPEVICKNKSLKTLIIAKNHLKEIPECIGELTELVTLEIWFNTITVLPESLTNLRKLRTIDIRGMNYGDDFQAKWNKLLPWVKIEFDNGCNCGF